VPHPKTLNAILHSPFTAFILKMRTEVFACAVSRHEVIKPPEDVAHIRCRPQKPADENYAPCTIISDYQYLGGTYFFHLLPWTPRV